MQNLNSLAKEDNQVNEEKPPPQECPRCYSDNTKFCYYNNYSVSQPRYYCKDCRRYWTHGGTLRDIPVGGSGRKSKRTKGRDQPSVSQVPQVVSGDIQQVDHHQQPLLIARENNELLGTFGGPSSSANVVMNRFGYGIHGGMTTNVTPIQNLPPIDRSRYFMARSFQQEYFNVGSNDLIGNPPINQSSAEIVSNRSDFRISQENQNNWNQSFNNTMNMNHGASTSGSMANSNNMMRDGCVFRSFYDLDKHDP